MASKREPFDRREKHSNSLIEASAETERLSENRNFKHPIRRQETYKDENNQSYGQTKQVARGEESGAPRNQLFDIHEKLLKQLSEMKVHH